MIGNSERGPEAGAITYRDAGVDTTGLKGDRKKANSYDLVESTPTAAADRAWSVHLGGGSASPAPPNSWPAPMEWGRRYWSLRVRGYTTRLVRIW